MKHERNRKPYECADVGEVLSGVEELSVYELGMIYMHLRKCEDSCEELVEQYLDEIKQEPKNPDHPL